MGEFEFYLFGPLPNRNIKKAGSSPLENDICPLIKIPCITHVEILSKKSLGTGEMMVTNIIYLLTGNQIKRTLKWRHLCIIPLLIQQRVKRNRVFLKLYV